MTKEQLAQEYAKEECSSLYSNTFSSYPPDLIEDKVEIAFTDGYAACEQRYAELLAAAAGALRFIKMNNADPESYEGLEKALTNLKK